LFDFSDGDFRADAVTLDLSVADRDDDGALDGTVVVLERSGGPDRFTVRSIIGFGPVGDGAFTVESLGGAPVVGIVLGAGEAGQVGVGFGGVTLGTSPVAQ